MFDYTSRYYSIETVTLIIDAREAISYKRRRFLPQGEKVQLLVEYQVVQGDRLDMITAQNLGDAEQFWRVCDANNTMNPIDLTDEPGRTIRIPVPQA